jgi:GNAT superfamily N-acetyltransferase
MNAGLQIPAGFAIRDAIPSDLPVVMRHRERMFRDMGRAADDRLAAAMAISERFFAHGFSDGTYRGWFVTDGKDEVVAGAGVVLLYHHAGPRDPSERRPVVVNVYTEPGFRRLGLARCLMHRVLEWCRERGFRFVYLHASDDGRPLYESMGFVPTNEMRIDLERSDTLKTRRLEEPRPPKIQEGES